MQLVAPLKGQVISVIGVKEVDSILRSILRNGDAT